MTALRAWLFHCALRLALWAIRAPGGPDGETRLLLAAVLVARHHPALSLALWHAATGEHHDPARAPGLQ